MSMKTVVLDVSLPFQSEQDRRASEEFLITILGFNSLINLRYLDRNPNTPRLYDSGVRYVPPDQTTRPAIDPADLQQLRALLTKMKQEPEVQARIERILRGVEIFLDIPALYGAGKGDCNELVPVRVAELWRAGEDAAPHLIKEQGLNGGWSYHAAVRHADGSQEDPSLILGMGGPGRAAERREEIRKNGERFVSYLQRGQEACVEAGIAPVVLGKQMELLGFLPRDGVFRVGGPPVDLLGGARGPRWAGRFRSPMLRAA